MSTSKIDEGLIKPPMKIDHHRSRLDPATCQTEKWDTIPANRRDTGDTLVSAAVITATWI